MKKRILILEQQSWSGGAQRVLEVVLSSLTDEFDPIVAFPDEGAFSIALHERGIATCTFPLGTYRPGKKSYSEMFLFVLRSLHCALKLAALIRKESIAVIYINGPRCLLAGVWAAWLTRRPSLFHLHLLLARKTEIFVAKCLARRVTTILACSEAAAESLLKTDRRLASKTTVLYNPVPLRVDTGCLAITDPPDMTADQITVGMVGRITESKSYEVALNAISKLRKEVQARIQLVVVGAPAPGCAEDLRYMQSLQESARRYGLSERILWAGYQLDPGPYYSLMDVLLHPSSSEALGLIILEALDRHIPVIAFRTGGIPEIVIHGFNGLLASPADADELCRNLESFVDDRAVRERLVAGARAGLDSRFSLETFRSTVRSLIHELCNAGISSKTGSRHEELAVGK